MMENFTQLTTHDQTRLSKSNFERIKPRVRTTGHYLPPARPITIGPLPYKFKDMIWKRKRADYFLITAIIFLRELNRKVFISALIAFAR